MKIHTKLTRTLIYDAARTAHVTFARCDEKGSRTRPRKFDVILQGHTSNRRNNFSSAYNHDAGDGYAATWDEWGIFLAAIFALDPTMHCGYYMGADDFHFQTGGRYKTLRWEDQCVNHKWEFAGPGDWYCKKDCGAVRRWRLGGPAIKATGQGFSTDASVPPRSKQAAEAFLANA